MDAFRQLTLLCLGRRFPRGPQCARYTARMIPESTAWPYFPTLARLALALAIGLLVGIERERRQKGAGVRTFAFAAILGAVGDSSGRPSPS